MKRKFSVVEGSQVVPGGKEWKIHKVMVENDPTSGFSLREEQLAMIYMGKVWINRACSLSDLHGILAAVEEWEANEMKKEQQSQVVLDDKRSHRCCMNKWLEENEGK